MPRQLEYMRVDKLPGDPRNPKLHDVDGIKASMQRFGYVEPVILDERTGQLVSGHGRVETLKAAHAAGLDRPEGVEEDDDGTWAIPVLRGWASKDDAEAGAYIVAANRLTEQGGWDDNALGALLSEVSATTDLGLDGTGYDADQLDKLLGQDGPTADPDTSPQMGQMEYRVLVACRDETHQAELLARFEEEGLTCQALIA